MKDHSSTVVMLFIMVLSGLLSIMSVWSDKLSDVRLTLNDVYMITLMSGWMLLFMGLYYKIKTNIIYGFILVVLSLFCIRRQLFISKNQYMKGMIPHHSMAVMMSKRLKAKGISDPELEKIVDNIIYTQEEEIKKFKEME